MDLVTGAMGSLLLKLGELLKDEYKLGKGVKKKVLSLSRELASMRAALLKVSEVPPEHLDAQVRLWAQEVRDLSYDMEDVVDGFLVRVGGSSNGGDGDGFRSLMKKMVDLFKTGKARRQIAYAVEEVENQVREVAARRERYRVDEILVSNASATVTIDPLLSALYRKATELVGIDEPRDEVIKRLTEDGMEIVSIVGFGGMGKTTLARAVHDSLEAQFHCTAFISVSQKPQMTKILKNILHQLDEEKYANINEASRDEIQLINELRKFLQDKRYLIIIDDIWKIESWKTIRYALADNGCASRIIATTCDIDIAEQIGGSYKLNPLTLESSKILFYGRIFGSEDRCPEQLAEVSMKILKKCGGVPLAIMTLASAVADKMVNPGEWDNMSDSIGTGLGDSPDVKNMRSILSLSYYSLPSHLRTCLLYLSVYPEDYEIPRDDIIWKWIAEGFITHENNNVPLFEVGASYFRDLINRCMIQPCIDYTGDVTRCRLHDMVLDFICSLSTEENFVTILNHVEAYCISSSSNVRRLSIQNRKEDRESTPLDSISKSRVRSVTTFPPAINQVPSLSSFDVVRVLDLSGCHLGENSHINLKDVGNLFHLRYLGLAGTEICELPAEIGKLQFLQVLDVKYNYGLEELPSTIYKLRRLKCLRVDGYRTRLPDGLGSLRSMEVLKKICANPNIVKELRNLSVLRELKIKFEQNASLEDGKVFVESLCHLKNISCVAIRGYFPSMDLLQEHWVPPPQLRAFESVRCGAISAVPAWIKKDPLHLANLFELVVGFEELREEDMQILGRLPALRRLWLWSARQTERVLPIGADGFHCLTTFTLYCASPRQIVFQQGAFPRVEGVLFNFDVRTAQDDDNGDFVFGLGNLVSLRQVTVGMDRYGATLGDVKEAVVALRHAVDSHENHPSITVDIRPTIRPDEIQKSNEMDPECIIDDELIGETKKLSEKFRKFRAQTCSDKNSAI